MERNGSYGKSWADQWESINPDDSKRTSTSTSSGSKYGKKVGEGLGKTKAVASTGFKKMKEGTSVSLRWIKHKYNKTTQKR